MDAFERREIRGDSLRVWPPAPMRIEIVNGQVVAAGSNEQPQQTTFQPFDLLGVDMETLEPWMPTDENPVQTHEIDAWSAELDRLVSIHGEDGMDMHRIPLWVFVARQRMNVN